MVVIGIFDEGHTVILLVMGRWFPRKKGCYGKITVTESEAACKRAVGRRSKWHFVGAFMVNACVKLQKRNAPIYP